MKRRSMLLGLFIFLPVMCFAQRPDIWINELHYENSGADSGEFVEVVCPSAIQDLSDITVTLYRGSDGTSYATKTLDHFTKGTSSDGFTVYWMSISNIQNGSNGMAISYIHPYSGDTLLLQFISYEGTFEATEGPAKGITSVDIGINEQNAVAGESLQLTGTGNKYEDFTWTGPTTSSAGQLNSGQVLTAYKSSPIPNAWINEFHYNNQGSDVGEFVEVAAPDTLANLRDLVFSLYNGSNGSAYETYTLKDFVQGQTYGGITFYYKFINRIQNGPDGLAFSYFDPNVGNQVLQFLSYQGPFGATDGIAYGRNSMDVGFQETESTPVGYSLNLTGQGTGYSQFSWSAPEPASPGDLNSQQSIINADGSIYASIVISGGVGWRILSAPVQNMPVSQLLDDTPIQGYPGHNPDYNKTFYTGYDGSGWTSPADLNGNLESGRGYILYFFNNTNGGSRDLPINLIAHGDEPSGDVTVSLHSNGDEWNLVGNPFDEAIDLSKITVAGGSLASSVGEIWDANSGSYIPTSLTNGVVSPWQGFFIQNQDASSITFPVSSKTTNAVFYKEPDNNRGFISLQLDAVDQKDGFHTTDKAAVLYFSDNSKDEWDENDAQKLIPLTSRYATVGIKGLHDGKDVLKSQDSRPYALSKTDVYDLDVQNLNESGTYTLSWPRWVNIPQDWKITLEDIHTGEKVDMRSDSCYTFSYINSSQSKKNVSAKPPFSHLTESSQNVYELKISIEKSVIASTQKENNNRPEKVKLYSNYPNPFNPTTQIRYDLTREMHVILSVYDITGRRVAVLVNGSESEGSHYVSWNAGSQASGIYFYRLQTEDQTFTKKMILIK